MIRFTLLLFIIPAMSFAQLDFTESIIDTSGNALGIRSIAPGDFNNDGYPDISTAHDFSNEIAVYFNSGAGDYGGRQMVSTATYHPVDLAAADLNNDGWNDLVSISLQDEKLAWYPNQNGSFGEQIVIDTGFFFTIEVVTDDFNADGYPDLIALDDTVVKYYQNDGEGNFSSSTLAGETEFYSISIADINNDDLPDVILGSLQLYTYINNGDGTFTRDTRNDDLIDGNFIFELETGDIDGDSDMDLAVYYSNTNADIDWYQNDGTGAFSFGGNITHNSNDVESMKIVDLNNDNHQDFLTAYGQTGELVWMKNDGSGNFSSEHIIGSYETILRHVATADTDQDGDIDILCSAPSLGLFYWENLLLETNIQSTADQTQKLYPNPAINHVIISAEASGKVNIFDLQGKIVKEKLLKHGTNRIHLDLQEGTYLMRWYDGESYITRKLIMQ